MTGLVRALFAGCPAILAACALLAAPAQAASPEDTVRAHFERISAEDYAGAEQYFTADYLHAFKGDVAAMDTYFLRRKQQLAPGYQILSVKPLSDPGKQTACVTLDFADPDQGAMVTVTERMHYYLIREKVQPGAPLRDADGLAWRIDIYDALSFDSLADARRLPYLYTHEAWPDDEGREIKSRQGAYRIQLALEQYHDATGKYPTRLYGDDPHRDDLLNPKYLGDAYPPNGFTGKPMVAVDLGDKSSGDFSYYSLDGDHDGKADGYFLVLHGKVKDSYIFDGLDAIMLLGANYNVDQGALAQVFAEWWQAKTGKPLRPGPGLGPDWGAGGASPDTPAAAPQPAPASASPPQPQAATAAPAPAAEQAAARSLSASLVAAVLRIADKVAAAAQTAPAGKPAGDTQQPLVVHSYGLP
jgi:hypothetical protein